MGKVERTRRKESVRWRGYGVHAECMWSIACRLYVECMYRAYEIHVECMYSTCGGVHCGTNSPHW